MKRFKGAKNLKGLERKWGAWIAVGLLLVFGLLFVWFRSRASSQAASGLDGEAMQLSLIEEGNLASSNLLTGSVKTVNEQKIYFDTGRGGDIVNYYVGVGDYVFQGQPLLQYETTEAQGTYDQAVRARDKANREIEQFKLTGGQSVTPVQSNQGASAATATRGAGTSAVGETIYNDDGESVDGGETIYSDSSDSGDGGEGSYGNTYGGANTGTAVVSQSPEVSETLYYNQLQDLYDAQADAQLAVNKAYNTLQSATEYSSIDGRVVEVNTSVDPSKTGGQLVMHLVNEGAIEVEGSLSEYDLATVRVGQAVKITSKVYPDKSWTGQISYVSHYPAETAAPAAGGGTSAASYPFKIAFDGNAPELKQGFKVNIEVVNKNKSPLVPLNALVPDGDKTYVWTYDRQTETVKKALVSLGRADAISQEIKGGLRPGQTVILNPSPDLEDGQKLAADQFPERAGDKGND